ncbi:MAG: hypothetical protein L0G99_03755 [Propionibacteriales bacterium]|nr:hypothetical protein [Propionibacteriales bacterium]
MMLPPKTGPGMVTMDRVLEMADLVDRHQVAGLSEQWRLEDGGSQTGRPGTVSNRAVMILFHLLVNEYSAFSDTAAADMVMNRMPAGVLEYLDLNKPGTKQVWIARIRRARERCFLPFMPYRGERRRRLPSDEALAAYDAAKKDPDYRKRLDRADVVSDAIVMSSVDYLPRDILEQWSGTVAIDGTSIPVSSNDAGTRKDSTSNPDIGAAWWAREGNHRADLPGRLDNRRSTDKYNFGYEADIMVMSVGDPDNDPRAPFICLGARLKRPGHRTGLLAASMVSSAIGAGIPISTLVTDQGIAPMAAAKNLQDPLYDLGVDIVCDYPKGHRGTRGGHQGLIWVEGHPYCSAMPKGLIDATIDYNDRRISEAVWLKRIGERERYLAKPNGKPRADGSIRYLHPTDHGRPVCDPHRKNAPAFCQQRTLLVPREHLALKYKQKYRYKTATWERVYRTNRSTNEGFNGYAEDPTREAIQISGARRIRGYAAQYVALAMKLAAANFRVITEFISRTPKQSAAIERKRVKRRAGSKTARNYRDQMPSACSPTLTAPAVPLRT